MSLPDNPRLVFIDTETTSLRPDRRVWDLAAIGRDPDGTEEEYQFFIHVDELDLGNADPMSLKIGRFYDRHPQMTAENGLAERGKPNVGDNVIYERAALEGFELMSRGAIIVGAVPNFDTEVIATRMRAHGLAPSWHYHLVDVETLAAGQLGMRPLWSFDAILAEYGITYVEELRHTALGDAAIARDLFDAIYNGQHWKVTKQ